MLLFRSMVASQLLLLLLLPLATKAAGFNCSVSGCANSGNCTVATGACACPTDRLLTLAGDRCDQVVLLPSASATKLVASNLTFLQSETIDLTFNSSFRGGIPLNGNELATKIYVCSNGYVTFNWDFCTTRVDLLKSSWTPPFVAPFATSFDFRKVVGSVNSTSEVSYLLVPDVATNATTNAAVKKIRDGIAELSKATAAIVFTWSQMSPPPLDTTQKISFQLILFTDFETVTGAVTLYSAANTMKDYFDWLPTLIGSRTVSGGSASLVGDKRSTSVQASLQARTIGVGVTTTARLTVLYNGTTPNYRQRCFTEEALPLQPPITQAVLGLCPRSYRQAMADPRYNRLPGQPAVFNLAFSQSVNATQISCAYDTATGGLLRDKSYSNITAANLTENLNRKLYEYCCDRVPNLCELYYAKLPTPTSDSYQSPSAVGFAMGTGELRSFDGQLSRFLSIGDFWLVKSSKLSVQVRMRNINSAVNSTTGITGVALSFMGSTNYSAEFHWNQTAQQIMVSSVSVSGPSGSFQVVGDKPLNLIGQNFNKDAIFKALTSNSLACAIADSSTWISAQSSSNGLSVSLYLDRTGYFNITSGLLGIYDDKNNNDLVNRTGATGSTVSLALESWRLMTNESLFKMPPTEPAPPSGWTGLYWSADWNQTQIQALFGGNATVYAAANQTCAAFPTNSVEYQNCLMEFASCGSQCAKAFIDQLASATQTLTDFTGCTASMPQWNMSGTEISVTEGTNFEFRLDTMILGALPNGTSFAKVSGPADLTVNQTGHLLWPSPAVVNANLTPIVVSVSATAGCASLVQLSVRLKRTSRTAGTCENSVEDFSYLTSPPGQNFRRDKIYLSVCKCNANYYTASCSVPTCPLACHSCNSSAVTACTACPANYAASEVAASPKLAVCSYTDQCNSSSCSGSEYKSCRSLDPALQTSSLGYQCVCNNGFEYPNSTSKSLCSDINECNILGYCNTAANRTCKNTVGSFTCHCSPGYTLQSGQCQDFNECNNTEICPNAKCVNTIGSYYCSCNPGYVQSTPSSNCTDVNECDNPSLSNCQQNCTNIAGGFNCSCFSGFNTSSGTPGSCRAETACANSTICSYQNLCARIGSMDTCNCPPPQTLLGDKSNCSAMKYCASNPCSPNGNCTEMNPGYNCSCRQYYELNAARQCVAIDYCGRRNEYPTVCPTGDNVDCSVNSTTNEPKCICKSGFSRSSTSNSSCVDINECLAGTSGCDPGSTDCANLVGSWLCKCKFGYKRENATHCRPAAYAIQVQATFTDLVYQANLANPNSQEFLLMAHIIESRLELGLPSDGTGQPTFRVSSMTNGSVVATGVVSYSTPQTPATVTSGGSAAGLIVVATPLNECLSNSTNDCLPAVHNCIDTVDGYICQCKSGYTHTGTNSGYFSTKVIQVCSDINECLTQCRNDSNKVCVNLPGSFTCNCIKGTFSNNVTSLPCEDPCIAGRCKNSGQCQYQANDQFPYRCVCMAGYTGFHCELLDDYYWSMQRNAIIIGVVLGVLLLICLAILIIFFLRKYRSNKNRADFYQSNFSDNAAASHSGGTYKGTQSMAMSDTSIPRAQHSAHHPSTYENMGYERETHKARTDYF